MPGSLVHFEKLLGQYQAAVSVLLLAHDATGGLLAVHEGYGNITLNPQEHNDFSTKLFNWAGPCLPPRTSAGERRGYRPIRRWNNRRERATDCGGWGATRSRNRTGPTPRS